MKRLDKVVCDHTVVYIMIISSLIQYRSFTVVFLLTVRIIVVW